LAESVDGAQTRQHREIQESDPRKGSATGHQQHKAYKNTTGLSKFKLKKKKSVNKWP